MKTLHKAVLTSSSVGLVALLTSCAGGGLGHGLIAHYPFDGDLLDHSGNSNHASWNGGFFYEGRVGRAYGFVPGQYCTILASPSLNAVSNTVMLAAWFKLDSLDSWEYVVGWGECGDCYGYCAIGIDDIDSRKAVWFYLGNDELKQFQFYAAGAYTFGEWCHVTCVYDGSEARLYINGNLRESQPANGKVRPPSSYPVYMNHHIEWSRMQGRIDEVRIYNRALTATEVHQVYRYEAGGARTSSSDGVRQARNEG